MSRRTLTRALTLATILSLLMSSVALADTTIADGDGVTPNADNNMAFGAVTCNVSTSKAAPVVVNRNGNGTNVFKNGSTVTVSVLTVAGAGLSATVPADANTITLPSNWDALDNNTQSSAVTSTVSLSSAAAGSGSGSVTYRATGVNGSSATIQRDDVMLVSWTTGTCAKTTPTITWEAPAAITYGTALSATQLNATGSVAGSFVYTPAAGTVLGSGTHTLQADFTPTNTAAYNSATKSVSITVNKAEQATLTVTDMPAEAQAYDTSFTVGSAGGSGTGAVSFSASGACSNVGAVITITAGSGVCSVTATKAADDNYNSTTSVAATVDATKATATVTLSNLDQTYNGTPKFATVTTVPGGLTVMVTYDDDELPPTNAGSYAVSATVIDANYEGSATGTLVIAKGDQTITFGALGDKTYGGATFGVSATSSSGLAVTFSAGPAANCSVSGTTVTIGNAGSCTVTAAQAGNSNWNPAPNVNRSFTIAKASGSVSINNIPSNAVFGGSFTPTYTQAGDGATSTTSNTPSVCSVSGGVVRFDAAGTCKVAASVAEGTNHLAAVGAEQTFSIAKAAGSVSITNLPTSPLLNSSFTPAFQALGDGATSVTSLTPSQCAVDTSTGAVTFIGVGTCTLRAAVAEGTNYLAATATYALTARYVFTGFDRPVDNNGVLNVVKAGQAVPLKFRLTDATGAGVTTLTSVNVTVASLSCTSGTTSDELEEYAAGSSGLQNLGDGYYQFNWKTPTNYANSCKTLRLALGDGANPHTALFQFRK